MLLLTVAPAVATDPIQVGTQHELFIDDHLIEHREGLTRVLHQPMDITDNPVILPDRPWEHRRIPFGSVYFIPEDKKSLSVGIWR